MCQGCTGRQFSRGRCRRLDIRTRRCGRGWWLRSGRGRKWSCLWSRSRLGRSGFGSARGLVLLMRRMRVVETGLGIHWVWIGRRLGSGLQWDPLRGRSIVLLVKRLVTTLLMESNCYSMLCPRTRSTIGLDGMSQKHHVNPRSIDSPHAPRFLPPPLQLDGSDHCRPL